MSVKKTPVIKSSEITSERLYFNRREFIRTTALTAAGISSGVIIPSTLSALSQQNNDWIRPPKGPFDTDEPLTSYQAITTYNNFYEFGTDKADPHKNAGRMRTHPWKVEIEGHVKKTGAYHLEDILRPHTLEDRIYRLRCVEGWSMVIPWLGFPLGDLIRRLEPTSRAKFVEFTTLHDPDQMPGQRRPVLQWPYVEALRMDEAMHPLTILCTGLYGKILPNQNGAPLRLVIPWKYGFKSIKSIVKIRFVEQQPKTTWELAAPNEYGFYSNVNPDVDHPRWSQRMERRIGEFFKRRTLLFNGYGDQVAHLYSGMDLRKYY